jgi:hypothetical protein
MLASACRAMRWQGRALEADGGEVSGNGRQTGPAPWMTLRWANTVLQGRERLAQSDPLSRPLSTQV